MRTRSFIAKLAALAALSLAICAAAPPATSPSPSLDDLLKRLTSKDFAVREAAQNELNQLPSSQLPNLEELVSKQHDPEVAARLADGIEAITVRKLTTPQLLSLDADDMPIGRVMELLNKQLGEDYLKSDNGEFIKDRVTLHVKDAPMWEILRQVHAQRPLSFRDDQVSSLLLAVSAKPLPLSVMNGCFALMPSINNEDEKSWVGITIFTDLDTLIVARELHLTKAIDKSGRSVLDKDALEEFELMSTLVMPPAWNWYAARPLAEKVETLAELKGSVSVMVAEAEKTVVFDVTKDTIDPLKTPCYLVKVKKWPKSVVLSVEAAPDINRLGAAKETSMAMPIYVTAVDIDGKKRETKEWNPARSTELWTLTDDKPLSKIEVRYTPRTHVVELPFDFKDVPAALPSKPKGHW